MRSHHPHYYGHQLGDHLPLQLISGLASTLVTRTTSLWAKRAKEIQLAQAINLNSIAKLCSDQMLIMRKRMRGLYNGFDTYVSKVMTVLNYIPAIQGKQDEIEVKHQNDHDPLL